MLTLLSGLGLGLSLIVAIGAQNVFVLRQGVRREHVALVVAVCALSDAVLILAGVAGLGILVERAPWLLDAARLLGAAFLTGY
ncbi:LysE/ArgO family amino acid transporter, partial [Streptomyces sp. SM12]